MDDQAPPKAFFEKLPNRTDQELLKMLATPEEFLPSALDAAREELTRRGVSPEVPEILKAEKEVLLLVEGRAKHRPLGWLLRILAFVLGALAGLSPVMLGIVGIVSMRFVWRKEIRRVKEWWLFYVPGAFVWVALHVILPLLLK